MATRVRFGLFCVIALCLPGGVVFAAVALVAVWMLRVKVSAPAHLPAP